MTRVEYEQVRDGDVAYTVEVRTDLFVDVDEAGRIIGVERIGDSVRYRDLLAVVEAATLTGDEEER